MYSKSTIFQSTRPGSWFLVLAIYLFIFLTTSSFLAFGQTKILMQPVSLKVHNVPFASVLAELTNKTGYSFIYNAAVIKPQERVSIKVKQVPLNIVLNQLFQDSCLIYKEIDQYIIVLKSEEDTARKTVVTIDSSILVQGRIVESNMGEPLAYASIGVLGKGMGVVANNEGRFALRLPSNAQNDFLMISYVGYQTLQVPIQQLNTVENVFSLQQRMIPLPEVMIKNVDPVHLLQAVIRRIPENYPQQSFHLRAFYRESVKKDSVYISAAEAALDVYHSSYDRPYENDQVKVAKSRKYLNLKCVDTVLVKVKESLKACLLLDLVKNIPDFLDEKSFSYYSYGIPDIVPYQDESAYMIPFVKKEIGIPPWFTGHIYISTTSLAILEVDFEVMPMYLRTVSSQLIVKNKGQFKAIHKRVAYVVSYRSYNNRYYLSHTRCEMNMQLRKRRQLKAKDFHVFFEMAVTNIDTTQQLRFAANEKYPWNGVFFDEITHYEPNFWKTENVIVPEELLEQTFTKK